MAVPNEEPAASAQHSRRERNMLQKRSRIIASAAALFEERGFDGVTTQEISDRADVGTGTLFRYAPSKGQLLMMVFNESFRSAIERGRQASAAERGPAAQIGALIQPIIASSLSNAANTAVYQRELLFGRPEEEHRAQGLALVAELENQFADRLLAAVCEHASDDPGQPVKRHTHAVHAARSIFAVLHLTLSQPATGTVPLCGIGEDLQAQVAQIIHGFLALTSPTPAAQAAESQDATTPRPA